jgi:hypothetical protein
MAKYKIKKKKEVKDTFKKIFILGSVVIVGSALYNTLKRMNQ